MTGLQGKKFSTRMDAQGANSLAPEDVAALELQPRMKLCQRAESARIVFEPFGDGSLEASGGGR